MLFMETVKLIIYIIIHIIHFQIGTHLASGTIIFYFLFLYQVLSQIKLCSHQILNFVTIQVKIIVEKDPMYVKEVRVRSYL